MENKQKILNMIGLAQKAGKVASGEFSTEKAVKTGKAYTVIVADDASEKIIERVVKEISTGNYGDGKIFVYNIEDVVRIRTGERGADAV